MKCGTKLEKKAVLTPTEVAIPKLEDMHAQLQSLIPDALTQKYLDAEQQATGFDPFLDEILTKGRILYAASG